MFRELLVFTCFAWMLFSCSRNVDVIEAERTVSCNQHGEYDYLEQYPSGQLCDSDTCKAYFKIWQSIFLKKNNLSQSFLDEHISISRTSLNYWNDGISYSVCYRLTLGWAIAYSCDQFIIEVSENSDLWSSLPRNKLLSEDQIKIALKTRAFSSSIDTVSSIREPRFETFDQALDELISSAQVNTLCSVGISLKNTGDLTMEAFAEYENEINSCIQGSIDLITGTAVIQESPCWVN